MIIGREYIQSLRLPIGNVQAGVLASYKIPGTPSVLVVDAEGIVRGVWIGAEPGREKEMLAKLGSLLWGDAFSDPSKKTLSTQRSDREIRP